MDQCQDRRINRIIPTLPQKRKGKQLKKTPDAVLNILRYHKIQMSKDSERYGGITLELESYLLKGLTTWRSIRYFLRPSLDWRWIGRCD